MKRRPYQPPVKYTAKELLEADIADLEVDLRCAARDGLADYAREVESQLSDARKRLADMEDQ